MPSLNAQHTDALLARIEAKRGFKVEYIRTHDAPGDSDSCPRTSVLAHYEGAGKSADGECVHFNSHIDVVEVGSGWTLDPFATIVKDDKVYERGLPI